MKKSETKRGSTVKEVRALSKDRTSRVLDGAVKRLRRLGKRRGTPDVKRAYRDAADLVQGLKPKKVA